MKLKLITEPIELNNLAKYLESHNLTVIKTKWIEDKATGFKKLHVWTRRRADEK